jgi:chemotaxis protein methyltransferase CheR
MTGSDYEFLSVFLLGTSGLMLGPSKEYLLEARLTPLAQSWGFSGIPELVETLRRGHEPRLATAVTEAMTTNETSFFRDRQPFEELKTVLLPTLIHKRRATRTLRIWSAACSTGQEPYSIAILLADHFPELRHWQVELIGSDVDSAVLARAAEGIYSQFEVQRGLPIQLLLKHFDQLPAAGRWQIKPALRERVTWMRLNLLDGFARIGCPDVVLCRNVMIYFELRARRDVLNRIAQRMAPDGYLFLGTAETVLGLSDAFERVHECRCCVYQRAARPAVLTA